MAFPFLFLNNFYQILFVSILLYVSFIHKNLNAQNKNEAEKIRISQMQIGMSNAIEYDDFEKFKKLIEQEKMNVNAVIGNNGGTILHAVAFKTRPQMLEYLLNNKVNVNVENNDGYTPLMFAILGKNTEVFRKLQKVGANINHKNKHGQSVAHLVIQIFDNEPFAKPFFEDFLLMKPNLSIKNDKGLNVLEFAKKGNKQMYVELLEKHLKK